MANSEKRSGGVLVIPAEKGYPSSVTFRSPTETKKVRLKDGGVLERPVVYTFERGKPRRVKRQSDYDWLRRQTHYAKERGVIPLFREIRPSKKLAGSAATEKILDILRRGLAEEGISLDSLVDSAESVAVEPGETPVVEEEREE